MPRFFTWVGSSLTLDPTSMLWLPLTPTLSP
jgi:hypothetical protein